MIDRVAMLSVHGSPLGAIGHKDTGGMNVYLGELGRELGRRGVKVDVFTRAFDPEVPDVVAPADNVRVIHLRAGAIAPIDKTEIHPHLPEFLANLRQFRDRQGIAYDVVHAHYWLSAWVAEKLARSWDVPWAVMYHTLGRVKNSARVGEAEGPLRIDVERRTLEAADVVIAGSQTERRQAARLYAAPPQKIVVIPPGVDLGVFRPLDRDACRGILGAAPDARIVLFVGRIEPLKGIDILIRAASVLETRRGLQVWIVGGDEAAGPELRRLTDLARRLGVAEYLRFFGAIPHRRLPEFYSAADVCVVPSYYESFGMVALEALACGTPVIASRVGGLQETVRDGENGYLVSWRCPEPFAEKLENLLGNPGLRQSFSRAARVTAQQYSWPRVADQMIELYACLVETRRGCDAAAVPARAS